MTCQHKSYNIGTYIFIYLFDIETGRELGEGDGGNATLDDGNTGTEVLSKSLGGLSCAVQRQGVTVWVK